MLNCELFVIAFNRCCKYSLQSTMWIWCCKPENKQTYFQVWMFPLGVVNCIFNHTMLATLNMRVFTSDRHLKSQNSYSMNARCSRRKFPYIGYDRMAPLGGSKSVLKLSKLSLSVCKCFVLS